MPIEIPKLMLITSGYLQTKPKELIQIETACHQGLPGVQLREKQTEGGELYRLAFSLRASTKGSNTFFSINERLDIALAVGADGIHLPEIGPTPQISKKLKPSILVGVSVHSLEMAMRAEGEGADYLLFGPIFKTPSKESFGLAQGLKNLESITRNVSIPVLAIGGITPVRVKLCRLAGAYGVAAMSAFSSNDNNGQVVVDFLKELE